MMDSHTDHLPRPASPSGSRHLMMPPFQSIPPPDHFSASDIPSTNKPSSISVVTASLYSPDGSSSTRRTIGDGAGVPLQTSPIAMHGGSSPDSHTGNGYTWTTNDSWAGRSPQHPYGGNRTPGALNPSPFPYQSVTSLHPITTSTASHNLSPVTSNGGTTPGDTHPSFHSSPANSMSHLTMEQANFNANNTNGILPPFRGNHPANYPPRPSSALNRSSSFPQPSSTMSPFVPGISSMLPMSTMAPSTRPGLAAPLSPLGSTGPPSHALPPPPSAGGQGQRLSDYPSAAPQHHPHHAHHHQQQQHQQQQHHHQQPPQHHHHQYMHNLANPGGPMALVSTHYGPTAVGPAAAYGAAAHFNGMVFQPQQRTPDKPHQCDQCPTAFTRNHDLKRHKRIHWEVKPYPCDGCDKAFSRKDALKRHKLVKCCGGKDDKGKREGSPASSSAHAASAGSSPEGSRRHLG